MPARVSVVADHVSFSRFTFSYYAKLKGLPIQVVRAWTGAPLFIHYVVVKTGDQGPTHTTRAARAVMTRLQREDPTLRPLLQSLEEWSLPDGSRATLSS